VNSSVFCLSQAIDVRAVSLFLMDILALYSRFFCCRADTIYIYLLHRSSFPSAELVTEEASNIPPTDTVHVPPAPWPRVSTALAVL